MDSFFAEVRMLKTNLPLLALIESFFSIGHVDWINHAGCKFYGQQALLALAQSDYFQKLQ